MRPGQTLRVVLARRGAGPGDRSRSSRSATVAQAAGISPAQLGRLERAEISRPNLEQLCRAARALGLSTSVRFYPVGTPVRDAAQLALLRRFEARLGSPLYVRREVPLPIGGDLRAWDAMVLGADEPFFIDAETRIGDVQAVQRRIEIKRRDDPRASTVLLVVTRSDHNRRIIATHRESLRALLPLDGGAVLRAISAGRCPPAGGIVMV